MSKKKPLTIDLLAGAQVKDIQGEILDIEGADISELEAGRGLFNDNHSMGYINTIGRVTAAKKIFKEEDCEDDRHRYYWNKVRSPFIYARGVLFDDDDHPNARAAAAIIRNIHRDDCPLKVKASVEGGVLARGISDPSILKRTKITKIALTFTPANQVTLVEPLNLDKSSANWDRDQALIKSVEHLAKSNVPTFKQIARRTSAEIVADNMTKINSIIQDLGVDVGVKVKTVDDLVKMSASYKLDQNIKKINELIKALSVGYGGAGAPTSRTQGAVLQSESVEGARGFQYIACDNCGSESVYMKHQTKCRSCGKSYAFDKLLKFLVNKNG